MYLLEHDAKEVLSGLGIPCPLGRLLEDIDAVNASALPPGPWIVKGQVASGGRGKAGVIKKATTLDEIRSHVTSIISSKVRGLEVKTVRIEQAVDSASEVYLGFLLDPASAQVRIIVSEHGGMDIEQVPRDHIHSALTVADASSLVACVRGLSESMPRDVRKAVLDAGAHVAHAFLELEALLIEINPLFVRPDGTWVAGDAKLITDDNALSRQTLLRTLLERRGDIYPETALKLAHGFDYVVVDPAGEIGLLTTGAGLSMMLIDEMRETGLKPYNFLDIRTGGLRGETARLVNVLTWIADGPCVRVLLVNIFAGITDLSEFSRLLVAALGAVPSLKVPVVARLVGNGLPAAREVLAGAGIALHTDLDAALIEVRRHLAHK